MSNHFYSFAAPAQTTERQASDITVATTSTSAAPIELRVEDATLSNRQVVAGLHYLAGLFATRDPQVVVPGTVLLD